MTKSSSGLRGVRSNSYTIKRRLRAAVMATPAVAALIALAPNTVQAVDLYWDVNGATAGGAASTTAAGTWNGVLANWSTDATGTSATQAWGGAGNTAVFSAGTGVTGASTVTVSGTQVTDGMRFEEGAVTLTGGTVELNTSTIMLDNLAGITGIINSTVTGTNGLTIARTGTTGTAALTLGGANTYTGVTSLDLPGGLTGPQRITTVVGITLNNNASLGATGAGNGTVFAQNMDAGFLALPGTRIINEDVTLTSGAQAAGSLGQLRNTGGTNTWAGNITLNGTINNLGAGLVGIGGSTGTLVITGQISSAQTGANTGGVGWAKTGAGTVVLRNANTFVGFMRQFGGIIEVQADGAMGSASLDGAFDGGTLQLSSASGATLAQTIAFRAPAATPAGFNYSVNEDITTAGPNGFLGIGANGMGMIDNVAGNNTFSGDVRFGGPSLTGPARVVVSFGAQAGTSLDFAGRLYSSASGPGTAAAVPDAREIHKVGAGTVIISGANNGVDGVTSGDADQYAVFGTMIIDAGSLVLRGANGTLKGNNLVNFSAPAGYTGAMDFIVNPNTSLVLDNTTGVNTNRIAANASIALVGGEAKLIGNDTVSVTQLGGGLNVGSYSTISVDQPANTNGAVTNFSLGTLNRTSRGTALLRGINGTTGLMGLSGALKGGGGTAGNPDVSILPEVVGDASVTGNGTDFVTIDGGLARPLTASEYVPLSTKVGLTDIVNTTVIGGDVNVTSATNVNSIKLTGGNNVVISPATRLLVKSGGILGVGTGASSISGGNLSFEDSTLFTDPESGITSIQVASVEEGIITVPTGSSLAISSDVSGGLGITKSGGGTLSLSGNNNYGHMLNGGPDTLGGKTTINAGVLEFTLDSNLGDTNAEVVLNGGTLRPLGTSSSSRGIELGSKGRNAIEVGVGATFTVNGTVISTATGNALTKSGPGTLDLTNIGNSYNGGTRIEDGFMNISTNAALPEFGTGSITLAGGSLRASVTGVINRNLIATGTNTTGGFWIAPGAVLTYGSGNANTIGISGSGNLAIDGGGTLSLANIAGAQMTHSGRYHIRNGSTLEYRANDHGTPNLIAGIGSPPGGILWNLYNGSTLRFTVSSTSLSGFGGTNAGINFGAGGGFLEITGANSLVTGAAISGAGTMTKTGTGTLSIRGHAGDLGGNAGFSGNIVLASGIISTSNQGVSLTGGNAETLLGTGTDASTGTNFLKIADGAEFLPLFNSQQMTLNAGRSIRLTSGTPILGSGASGVFTVNGVISSDPGVTGLRIDGQGTTAANAGYVVFGGVNTYAGDTIIKTVAAAGGTGGLKTSAANALPSTTTVHFDAQAASRFAILDLAPSAATAGFSQTVAGIVNDGTLGTARITNSGNGAAAQFTVANATDNTFTGEITGNLKLGHNGAGALILAGGNNTYSGGTNNVSGTVRVPATGSIGAGAIANNGLVELQKALTVGGVTGTGTLTVGDGAIGVAVTATHVRQATANVAANSTLKIAASSLAVGVSSIDTLNLATGARFDLNDNKLFTLTGPGNADINGVYSGVQGEVQRASNGGAWDSPGITTTQGDALTGLTSIGVATGEQIRGLGPTDTDLFAGHTITGATTIAMYTYAGDANLDGFISGDDYSTIDFNAGSSADGWVNGDFNYDGIVSGDDYSTIDFN
ncbi:MAG: hypothetical protein QOF78_177, partial [Phycisphaerales bacterium]|nr:hypothetical protein [Phycisphaerales bacterium]